MIYSQVSALSSNPELGHCSSILTSQIRDDFLTVTPKPLIFSRRLDSISRSSQRKRTVLSWKLGLAAILWLFLFFFHLSDRQMESDLPSISVVWVYSQTIIANSVTEHIRAVSGFQLERKPRNKGSSRICQCELPSRDFFGPFRRRRHYIRARAQ
jgi:hypothetical protein